MANQEGSKATAVQSEGKFVDRRRGSLPQPDFAPYIKANAYPGNGYFFVGHSYNVDSCSTDAAIEAKRVSTLKSFFSTTEDCVSVKDALHSSELCDVLSRCERDLLSHLPEGALIGRAIDPQGGEIEVSFTIWRKEMRRQTGTFEKPKA